MTAGQWLWRDFATTARILPRPVWRVWLQTLLVGFLLVALLTVAQNGLAQWAAPRGLQSWDEGALPTITANAPLSFARSITWESPGNLFGMLLLVSASVIIAVWSRRPLVAATIAAVYPASLAILFFGWSLWDRPRPQLVAEGIAAPGLHSFPSGHILLVVVIYGLLFYLWLRAASGWWERGLALLLYVGWVGLISLARLVLGAHWPSDIIGGVILGLAALAVAIAALRRAEASGGNQ